MTNESRDSFGSGTVPRLVIQDKYKTDVAMPEYNPPTPDASLEEKVESQLHKLPKPTGYRILLIPYTIPPRSRGGIHFTHETLNKEQLATTVGYVVELGPSCYTDDRFQEGGPWCKKGDYILFGRYAGARIMMNGEGDDLPLRLINDDEVLAVISNPEDYVGVS